MAVITLPTTGEKVNAFTPEEIIGLVAKEAQSLITGADITLKYPQFETTVPEWGGYIEEARIPAAESETVDPNTTAICGPYYFNADARYFDDFTEKRYASEIRRTDVMKVLRGEMDFGDLVAQVVRRNVEGFRKDTNAGMKWTFSADAADVSDETKRPLLTTDAQALSVATSLSDPQYKGVLVNTDGTARYEVLEVEPVPTFELIYAEIAKVVTDMEFDNSTYTVGSNVYGARRDDLCIVMPHVFAAKAGVEYMQKLYNMVELGKLPEIILTDGLTWVYDQAGTARPAAAILIMDKRTVRHVTRLEEVEEPHYIHCRRSYQYILNVEDMIKILPFYKAWAIAFAADGLI